MSSSYNVIGLMSGTSLDGLDIVFCQFNFTNQWQYKILKGNTIPYPADLKDQLADCTHLNGYELTVLDHALGKFIGDQVNHFMQEIPISPDFISSHGHTVFHQPHKGFTLQIGSLHQLHAATRIPVIGDFRSMDVAFGGQGAPLVPIGDKLLFGEFDYCLNLGGIANISCEIDQRRIAYDICPNNLVLNSLAKKEGFDYDDKGRIAEKGNFNGDLFDKLNEHTYFEQAPPKSLGIEWIDKNVMPLLEKSGLSNQDVLHTYCHHIAYQIRQCMTVKNSASLLITGGGAFNSFLIKMIREYGDNKTKIIVPEKEIIEFKEALIFAFLGILKWRNEVNILRSVTGATKDSCSGTIIFS